MYYPRRIHRIRIYPYGRLKYLVFVEIQVSVQMSPDVFTLGFFLPVKFSVFASLTSPDFDWHVPNKFSAGLGWTTAKFSFNNYLRK